MSNPTSTIPDFDELVPDEAAAEALFLSIRWPDGVCCPHCGSRDMTRLSTRAWWQCRVCRAQTSLRSGTVLHRTRIPLRSVLYAAWRCSSLVGASTRSIAADLGARYETIWVMVHKIRAAMAERGVFQLGGAVELGAAAVRVTKSANGDPRDKPPVIVAMAAREEPIAPGADDLRLETADLREPDAALIERTRERHVEAGAEVRVERLRVDPWTLSPRRLRCIERQIRIWLRNRFGGVSRRYLANYLAEFAYVQNRCRAGVPLFPFTVRRIGSEPWRPRSDLALSAP